MSDIIKDGGPAFPNTFVDVSTPGIRNTIVVDGMTLRDWFAGQALAGFVATLPASKDWDSPTVDDDVAKASYRFADAMLAQRDKKT